MQIGGTAGSYRIQQCPIRSSAAIVAGAWRDAEADWRELAPVPAGGPAMRF